MNTDQLAEQVQITPDIVYSRKFGMALTFDLYQPQISNGAAVIFINSGGWVSWFPDFFEQSNDGCRLLTDKELSELNPLLQTFSFRQLLAAGFTVFVVRHSHGPKFELSEIVEDLRQAVRFIRFHANKYKINREQIGLWGASAGGHLALLLATTSAVEIPDAAEAFNRDSSRVAAVVAYCPPSDLQRFISSLTADERRQIPALALKAEQLQQLSPLYQASSDVPPILIVHGRQDRLVPIIEGESMYQALVALGVPTKFVRIPNAGHGFYGDDREFAIQETMDWFMEYLSVKS